MTSRYADTVTDQYARPIPGALVYVYIWDLLSSTAGALEALTTDTATSLLNPLTTDPFGGFYFNAPNGAKLLEVHFGGKLQYREQIQVGPIPSGPPGGPGALFGLFTNLINITAGGATLIASSGYSVVDKGAAVYVYDAAVNSAYVAANPLSSGLTADGKGFRLSLEQDITPEMLGATGLGIADDYPAFAASINLLPAGGGAISVLAGTYNLLTEPTWGTKDIRWNISSAAIFTGAGTGSGKFPNTAYALRRVKPYFDDSGVYTDRSAIVTVNRTTSSPTGIVPSFWSLHSGNGDNSTFRGVSSGFLKVQDIAGITSGQRGALYGLQVDVAPQYTRNNTPFDDCANLILTNDGRGTATECIFIGTSSRAAFAGTGYVTAGTMTITAVSAGALVVGTLLSGSGIPVGTRVAVAPDAGGVGTYTLDSSFTSGSAGSPIAITGLTRDYQSLFGGQANAIVWGYAIGDYDYVIDACFGGTIANVRKAVFRAPNNVPVVQARNASGSADITFNKLNASNEWEVSQSGTPVRHLDALTSKSPSGGIGYSAGAGAAATQATSKSTAVALNNVCGAITMNNASLGATTIVSFTLTNSAISPDDDVRVWVKSGNASVGSYRVQAEGNASGSRTIVVENKTAGALSEALILGFMVHKAVVA